MWIAGVDVPQALVDAHRDGSLVLFVGAGASVDIPSDLPSLELLTAELASKIRVTVPSDMLPQLDLALGYLADRDWVDLHKLVADRLCDPASTPNRWHRAVADLARHSPTLRVVTTNYDLHLSTVLDEAGVTFDEYQGPALPMGDDFSGLVYLHGSLRQPPKNLILTDRDFGRAYLTDGWASRFLERMFAAHDVLFIGYSHKDVVMTYLARGLRTRSDRTRYALTPEPHDPSWLRLRVTPLGYGIDEGSHEAGVGFIEGLARHASMGLLGHRRQVAQLLAAAPSDVPEELSYLESVLADATLIGFFTEFARGRLWLDWVASRPEFRTLFDPNGPTAPTARTLAWWFAKHFVLNEEHTDHAMTVLQTVGRGLGTDLWNELGARLHSCPKPRPAWLAPWIVLLAESLPADGQNWVEYALMASDQWPAEREVAIHLFSRLTEPQLAPARFVMPGAKPSFEIGLRGNPHDMKEAWTEVFVPNLSDSATDLIVIADHRLREAHRLLAATATRWDRLSWGRSAIEPHKQDRFLEPIDVLIDAARDCVESLLNDGNGLGAAYLKAWAQSSVPLLRRLAIHGWIHRKDVDATAKLTWLHGCNWWFDSRLHHEVFRLLAATIANAERAVGDAIVATIAALADDPVTSEDGDDAMANAEMRRDHPVFARLAWISRHAPDLESAHRALSVLTERYPGWRESEYPDLLRWSESGFDEPRPPITVGALHDMITTDPAEAVTELRRYESVTSMFQRPNWNDAADVLRQAVHTSPADGLAVLAVPDLPTDLFTAIVSGWSRASIDDATGTAIVQALATSELPPAVTAETIRLLADFSREGGDEGPWRRLPAARELALTLWSAASGDQEPDDVEDWLTRAINRPAGQLAVFWLHALASDWRQAGDDWAGIPESITTKFERMLDADTSSSALVEVLLASRLHFFFGAESDWCQARILPLLNWSNPKRALRNWQGFLTAGRSNNQLLALGLLEHYLEAAAHYSDFPTDHKHQLAAHLCAVVLFSEIDPRTSGLLRDLAATDDLAFRADWHQQVARQLTDLPTEDVEQQWARWIRQYWADRINGLPRALEIEEASAMAEWAVNLAASMHEAVGFATRRPARIDRYTNLLHDVNDDQVDRSPADIARLVAHLLKNTTAPLHGSHRLRLLVPRLRTHGVDVEEIIEQSLRLGISDAGTW